MHRCINVCLPMHDLQCPFRLKPLSVNACECLIYRKLLEINAFCWLKRNYAEPRRARLHLSLWLAMCRHTGNTDVSRK